MQQRPSLKSAGVRTWKYYWSEVSSPWKLPELAWLEWTTILSRAVVPLASDMVNRFGHEPKVVKTNVGNTVDVAFNATSSHSSEIVETVFVNDNPISWDRCVARHFKNK